jgi:hypothetical protein
MQSQALRHACDELNRLLPFRTATIILFVLALLSNSPAQASPYSDLFTTTIPEHLGLTTCSSGYGSDSYDTTYEGFEFEQSVTRFLGLVGHVSAYQIYRGDGFNTPFPFTDTDQFGRVCNGGKMSDLISRSTVRHLSTELSCMPGPALNRGTVRNFGRFEGGVDLMPFQNTSIVILGGKDVGDSETPLIDGEFSSWILFHSPHPINLSFNVTCYFRSNTRNSSRIDLRTLAFSTGKLMLLVGAGGAIWGGGGSDLQGQAGPDIGVFLNTWLTTIDLQIGYGGNPHTYGLISVSKQFGWDE